MALLKNTASQKIAVKALDAAGEGVTGGAANITCKVAIDHGTATALTDTNPTETEDGVYLFDLTQAETNGNHLLFYPESATADVVVIVLDGANGHTIDYSLYKADVSALATASALATVDTVVDAILVDTDSTIPGTLATLATASALATVDGIVDDILVDTGTTLPGTLATLATASALGTVDGNVTAILEDTGTTIPTTLSGIDTKIGTPSNLGTGANLSANLFDLEDPIVSSSGVLAAAAADLDILTGTDGVILATSQTNYPALKADTAYDVTTVNGTLATTFAS